MTNSKKEQENKKSLTTSEGKNQLSEKLILI